MKQQIHFQAAHEVKTITVEATPNGLGVTIDDKSYHVIIHLQVGNKFLLEVDGQRLQIYVATDGEQRYVWLDGDVWTLQHVREERSQFSSQRSLVPNAISGRLTATMPGLVREVLVAAGDSVVRGATLIILEAMKMELRISAAQDGRVSQVHCALGQVVARHQLLVELSE